MFRLATPQNTPRARPQVGNLTAITLPSAGMNARDTFAVMGSEYAISLINVMVEPYGLRTRKGYTEWATNLPSAGRVQTVMNYYPPNAAPAVDTVAGKMFAAINLHLYEVTAGGPGPWVAEVGVGGTTDYWTWINFTNIAGTFLIVTNDGGGYSYYDGTNWVTPTMGGGVGQIANVDPANFVFVVEFKKRLWFIEKDSTRAWYLPVSQITGAATMFDFGEQFRKGGRLNSLSNWTVDSGEDLNDMLVAVSSQGNVVVYKGVDPASATDFTLHGVWDVGALPVGRRSVTNHGGDVLILSQFGVTPLSLLLSASQLGTIEQRRLSFLIAPLIARLMRDYNTIEGWAIRLVPTQELLVITVPQDATEFAGAIFALKVTTGGWSILKDLPYLSSANIDSAVFAGTDDGRVVRAFDGPLDNVPLGEVLGTPIKCQVTPAFQSMGTPGQQKMFKLVRPTFITTLKPMLKMQILVDYGPPKPVLVPTLPDFAASLWDADIWDGALWSGVQDPIKEWLGCQAVGFVGTVQLDYQCGGSTLLAAIDYWTVQGGVM